MQDHVALTSGTITPIPTGINCGTDCSEKYNGYTKVKLTANPTQGSTFTGWNGACSGSKPSCQVTMDQARNVSPAFARSGTRPEKPLPPIKNATKTTAAFDGKRLYVRLKCPTRFKPKCSTKATPIAHRSKQGKPIATKPVKKRIGSGKWTTVSFRIKPALRAKVTNMACLDKKLLHVRQLITSRWARKKKAQKAALVFHSYKVRVKR